MNLFDQVTRTKVLLPRRRPDLLSRQRLLDLLFDLTDHKLVVVAAPAGYGKTSLLVDMAGRTEMPVCWYALDSLDRDPQRFIAHLIGAIAHCFPQFGPRSWAALQDGIVSSSDLDRLVTTTVNEAYEHIPERFLLVLDDYHFVDDSQEIDYFVNQFIQQVYENCHIIIASRTLLTLPDLPLMVARSQVGGLSFDELAFRADEIQSLMLQNHHITLPESVAEELVRETEGWITGLLLSTQTMWQNMTDRLRVARVSGVGLYEYLAQQVLDQQAAPLRDFLLRTSLLEEFDAQLCEAVLGPADYPGGENWSDLIEVVLRNSLFVLPVGDEGTWLRYHHLFQEFLQARLAQEHPDEEAGILRRLATVRAESGEWEKAYDLYQRLEDTTSTADLIELAGPSLVKAGRTMTLGKWLDTLPVENLASRPALLSLRGTVAVKHGEVHRGLSLHNQAVAAFETATDMPNLARALVQRALDHRILGEYQVARADAEQALTLAEGDESLRDVKAEALRAKGLSLSRKGQLKEAIEHLSQSLTTYSALDDMQTMALVLMELGMANLGAGRYNQALTHYNQALDYWRKTDNVFQLANLLNNLGVLHHLRGDYEQAVSLLEEALTCASQSGHTRMEAFALASIGENYADLEAENAALAAYRQAREIAQRIDDRQLLLYLELFQATLARSKGNLGQARELLESAGRLAQQSASDFEQGLYQLEVGRLALDEGDTSGAIANLEVAARCFDDSGQQVEAARAHFHLATAHYAAKDSQAAADHLGQALNLGSELESQHTLIVAGREAKTLLGANKRDSALGLQASQLLKQVLEFEQRIPILRRRVRERASTIPFDPPSLRIQALGRAQVTLNGRLVSSADWQTQDARHLFFCLLAHPDGMTKEEVGAILWPDSSPAQLKRKFKNAIYRLRQALRQEVVLFDEDCYRFNRDLDYAYDVESFQAKLAQATTDPADQLAAFQAAADLYKGPYLSEADDEWAWWQRERLAQAHLETNLKLIRLLLEAGRYGTALDYCQQALAQDACLEEAHRLAMRVHAAMGNRAAIVRQFKQCQQTLLEEVNAPPSPQTVELYETLTHHNSPPRKH
jgi:ATP/maltotriose-dependent transcriptional regulator MalT